MQGKILSRLEGLPQEAIVVHVQLSLYVESEITSLIPQVQLSIVCSTYCQWQKAGREPGNKTTHSVLDVNQYPVFLWHD